MKCPLTGNKLPTCPVPGLPRKPVRTLLVLLGVGALLGALAALAKKLLGSPDDGWSPQPPLQSERTSGHTDWGPSPFAEQQSTSPKQSAVKEPIPEPAAAESQASEDSLPDGPGDKPVATAADENSPEADAGGKGESDQISVSDDQAPVDDLIPGSYVGDNPPPGYDIKGNERSMKYHLPNNLGWARTKAEIWFNSPEAAEAAGFTRALR